MTPERQKWWDSLPKREKMLREQIWKIKSEISRAKYSLQLGCFKPKAVKLIIAGIKKQKVTLTALKHELDRTTVVTYIGCYEYRCKKCGGTFEDDEIKATCMKKGAGLIVDGHPITTILKPKVRKDVKPLSDNGYIHYLRLFAKKWVRKREEE